MATITQSCTYSNPVRYDGTVPTLPTHTFFFKNSVCTNNASTTTNFTVGYNPTTTISSSTSIQVYGSMSAGEVMITVFLFMLIVIELFKMLTRALDKIKTKKKFIGYTNAEVEIKEEF